MLCAYRVAGRPDRPPTLADFEGWSELVRGALMWVGVADPVKTMDRVRESEPVLGNLRLLMDRWLAAFGDEAKTVADLVRKAEETEYACHPDDQWRSNIPSCATPCSPSQGETAGSTGA